MDCKAVGHKLKMLRIDRNISQSDLAKAIGISQNAISSYEAGKRTPRNEIKVKLANYFGQTIGSLFFGE